MKLAQIFLAQDAWREIQEIKKKPKTAYKLMRFGLSLDQEFKIIIDQKNKLITDIGSKGKDGAITIAPDTLGAKKFILKFNEFLDQESELSPVSMTIEKFCNSIKEYISDKVLILIEPFFAAD